MRRKRRKNKQMKFIMITSLSLLFILTVGYATFSTNLNISAKGNIKEKSRVIKSWTSESNEDFHTDFYRENIITATFLDTNKVPDNAIESWDVSEAKDKGVMAYVIPSTSESNKYDLFIGATRGVVANEDSSHLFYKFQNITSIKFNNFFDTQNAIRMTRMFAYCSNLTTLDLSNFNTQNVTDMFDMFSYGGFTKLDLTSFNTSNVTNMQGMFYYCSSLTDLDISSFDTSQVINMSHMFERNGSIKTLNLCSFNTHNVVNVLSMFTNASELTNVFVGQEWTTTNAASTAANMFYGTKVSSVTTGQC